MMYALNTAYFYVEEMSVRLHAVILFNIRNKTFRVSKFEHLLELVG